MDAVNSVSSAGAAQDSNSTAPPGSASELIRQATDSRTGVVDTRKLAGWIADAAQHDFDSASQAYEQVDAELSRSDPATAGHFSRDVAEAFSAQGGSESGHSSTATAYTGRWPMFDPRRPASSTPRAAQQIRRELLDLAR